MLVKSNSSQGLESLTPPVPVEVEILVTDLTIGNYRRIGDGFKISVEPLTALVGPNGSGKSNGTLMKSSFGRKL